MKKPLSFILETDWWMRSGDRLCLGLGVSDAFQAPEDTLPMRARRGLEMSLSRIDAGEPVLAAFRSAGLRLPIEAWCLLEAGIRTGRLGEAMIRVGQDLRDLRERRRALVGRLWYPAVVVATGMGVMAVLLVQVVPELRAMNQSLARDAPLPWITEHLGQLYGGVLVLGVLMLSTGTLVALILQILGRRSLRWARLQEWLAIRLPIVGWLRCRRRESRIMRQLGTLLEGGVHLPESFRLMAENAPDAWEKTQLLAWRDQLIMGTDFARSLEMQPLLRPNQRVLLVTGQECGKLEAYLMKMAVEIEATLNWRLDQYVRALEPLTVVVLAIAVGGLVLAYLMPMVQLIERLA